MNDDVLLDTCLCTGSPTLEPHLFFDPHDLIDITLKNKMRIVDSTHGTRRGHPNIMYGEDYGVPHLHGDDVRNGFVTILAQKRTS